MDRQSAERATLARLLREVRERAGMTQAELADRLETTQSTVSKIETGERRLDLIELRQFTDAVGADLATVVAEFEARL